MREQIRLEGKSPNTAAVYWHWTKGYIRFHGLQHPKDLGVDDVRRYLNHLVNERRVSKNTHGWASLAMVQRYAHLGHSHVAVWAGNISSAGTNPAQVAQEPTTTNAPEGALPEGDQVGWLMGLEPTTTRITRRSRAPGPCEIKQLPTRRKPKAA
jgi:hypothetical protein